MVVTGAVKVGDRAHYKAKAAELEEIVEAALAAFNLIPVRELRNGNQWFPSEDALKLIEKARDAAHDYASEHWSRR